MSHEDGLDLEGTKDELVSIGEEGEES